MSAHSGTRGPQALYWTGVLNNYTEDELSALCQLDCPELVIDKEVGKEGTPHLHIYMKLAKRGYLTKLKALSQRAHWEVVRNRDQAIRYCSKGEVVVSRLVAPPARSRLSPALDAMHRGGLSAVAREYPEQFVLHHRGLQALQYQLLDAQPKPVPEVAWYWGSTGSGKTRAAYGLMSEDNIYLIPESSAKGGQLWFDGYIGQKVVVIDDYRPWWCTFSFFLKLLDRYPIRVAVKGGFVNFIPEKIVVTTPLNIEETFAQFRSQEDIEQVRRRVHVVKHFVTLRGCSNNLSRPMESGAPEPCEGAVG